MGTNYSSKVVNVAIKELGYQEKKSNAYLEYKHKNVGSNNYTKYGKSQGCNGQPWCDAFVDWCFIEAYGRENAKKLLNGFSNYTPDSAQKFKNIDRYYKRGKTTPKKGDVIFFYSSSLGRIGHTGIVEKVDTINKKVHTIEGNTSSNANEFERDGGCVARKIYSFSDTKIDGYGRPAYDKKPTVKTIRKCNLYKKKYIKGGKYTSLQMNTVVGFIKDCGDGWSQVSYKGEKGYVKNTCLNKKGLSRYNNGFILVDNTPLRASNSKTSKVLCKLSKKTKVKVVGKGKFWVNVKYDSIDGFVYYKKINFNQ